MIRINNENIGKYLEKLIKEKYGTQRRFCGAYLEKIGDNDIGDNLKNLENRISQIKKGNKSIQIDDIPVFSELLGVSFEQILSGGYDENDNKDCILNRQTNYNIAQLHDEKQWIAYIGKDEKPILNPDEYGKNILDYAIEFENYDLIKFLVNNKYVWFVDEEEGKKNRYLLGFGAGTSINRCEFTKNTLGIYTRVLNDNALDSIKYKAEIQEWLRLKIISMAVKSNDLDMLKTMKAREIPELYYDMQNYDNRMSKTDSKLDEEIIMGIINSNAEILDYFTDSFEVEEQRARGQNNTFIFPYITQLLDCMIENNSKYTKQALYKILQYNANVCTKLNSLLAEFEEAYVEYFTNNQYCEDDEVEELIRKKAREEFEADRKLYTKKQTRNLSNAYASDNIINVFYWCPPFFNEKLVTNIVDINAKSNSEEINNLIKQINNKYKEILDIISV